MKIIKYLIPAFILLIIYSCTKNTIEYDVTSVPHDAAELQVINMVPQTTLDTNIISEFKINNGLSANSTSPLTTYNMLPNSSLRYYVTNSGQNNLKMSKYIYNYDLIRKLYVPTDKMKQVYDQSFDLKPGKQVAILHDYSLPPKVFDVGYPFTPNITEYSDSVCWVRFYNFMYEKEKVPITLTMQYQYQPVGTTQWVNIGNPVSFGQCTEWSQVIVKKSLQASSGNNKLTFRMIDQNGKVVQVYTGTPGKYVLKDYTEIFDVSRNRRYHHIMAGYQQSGISFAKIRSFAAL